MADANAYVYPNTSGADGLAAEAADALRTLFRHVVDETSVGSYDVSVWSGAYPGIGAASADDYRPSFEDWLHNDPDGPDAVAAGCHLAVSTDFGDGQAETGDGEGEGEDAFLAGKTAAVGYTGYGLDQFRTLVAHEALHAFVDDRLAVAELDYDPTVDEHELGSVTAEGAVTPLAMSYDHAPGAGRCSSDASRTGYTRAPTDCANRTLESTYDAGRGEWFAAGTVSIDANWRTVELSPSVVDPVAFAKPPSFDGPHPAHVRLRNVGPAAFDCRVEEWLYQDDWHHSERVGTLAVDTGRRWTDDYAAQLEANYAHGVDTGWTEIPFHEPFDRVPVVLTQAQTYRGHHPIVTRVRNVDEYSFEVRLQEEEAQGWHTTETVGWLAVEPGSGRLAGASYEAGVVRDRVDERWEPVGFDGEYADPVFLADVQTSRGHNTCGLRRRELTSSGVELHLDEERSADDEVGHLNEDVGYLVLEPGG